MEEGIEFFLLGLPAVTPWSGVFAAHMARRRVWEAMDGQQKVLDVLARGQEEEEWDIGDVSEFVMERNRSWIGTVPSYDMSLSQSSLICGVVPENGFTVKERGDICVSLFISLSNRTHETDTPILQLLYALTSTPSHLIYYLSLSILSSHSLLTRILAEIKPHIHLTEGLTIGKHSSPPSLTISSEGLTKKCPLLRSTYLETLRFSRTKGGVEERFQADRFVNAESKREDRESAGFMEKECLALVAGVLMMWEFEPVEGEVWGGSEMEGIFRGGEGKRVRVKRRKFEWDT